MNSPELWLVRHGETEWSRSGQHTSRTDLPLTPEGEARARKLGEMLQTVDFAIVLTSPMKRAADTCRLAGLSASAESVADLKEWDYGQYEGRTTPEIQREHPGWTIWSAPAAGGETAIQVGARADRVIERVRQALKGAQGAPPRAALFGHGHMLRVIAARWLRLDACDGRYFALSTGTVSVLGHERDTRVIQRWNQQP